MRIAFINNLFSLILNYHLTKVNLLCLLAHLKRWEQLNPVHIPWAQNNPIFILH
jgi:hypothetical protein